MRNPAKYYFNSNALYAYDSLILVCASRFTENDVMIAQQAKNNGVTVFFVRNKVGSDVDSSMRGDKRTVGMSKEEAARLVCSDITKELCRELNKVGTLVKSDTMYLASIYEEFMKYLITLIYCIEANSLHDKLAYPYLYSEGERLLRDVGSANYRN